jgi:hydroxyacylglutathione hydrolase
VQFSVLEVPGHTLDHIAYAATTHTPPLLFCGDTLFAAGCGRLFEGTPAQMFTSLQKLASLPANSRIFCTHEYTLSNLKFAHAVEPENAATTQRLATVTALRADNQITLPSDLALELATNPFLRSDQESVRRAALTREPEVGSDVETFAAIRRWKDQF